MVYLPKFIAVTGALYLFSDLFVFVVVDVQNYSRVVGTIGVAVSLPLLSFLLNAAWTFSRPGS